MTLQPPRHASFTPLGPLIGRDLALATLLDLISRGERLVTLTGGAGFGKSRLAHALVDALTHARPWEGGVWRVVLGAAGPHPDLAHAVTSALGTALAADAGAAALAQRLRALGPTLLLLDDVDRVIDTARDSLPAWLAAAPELTIIAVSREALALPGEVRHLVGPLSVGDPTAPGDAERLYTLRAEAVSPGCSTATTWAAAVSRLVRRLDGNPLALELAAARVSVLPPAALLDRLSDRFAVLRDPVGGAGRALWDSLNASWAALSDAERRALMRASVLEGPARVDALEAVVGDHDGGSALEHLDALVRKSLATPAPPSAPTAAPRLALFDSVRAFARVQLARVPGLAAAAHAALAAWCDRFVAARLAAMRSPAAAAARAELIDEVAHILAAAEPLLRHLDAPATAAQAGRLLVGVESVFRRVGAPPRAIDAYATCAAAATLPPAVRVPLLLAAGTLSRTSGDPARARAAFDAATAAAQAAADPVLEGVARYRAVALIGLRDLGDLEAHVAAAIPLLADAGRPWELAEAWAALATVQLNRGALDRARASFGQAVPAMRRGAMTSLLGPALNNLGQLHGLAGRWTEAAGCFREALAAAEADRHRMLAGVVRRNLGECALRAGDDEDARHLFEAARAAAAEVGDLRTLAVTSAFLAGLALLDGDAADAAELCASAREYLALTWHDPVAEGLVYALLALTEAASGDGALASATMARAATLLEGTADPSLARALAIHQLHLALTRGVILPDAARVRAAAVDTEASPVATPAADAPRQHQVVFARRLLDATLARAGGAAATPGVPPPSAEGALVVAADGTWFAPPAGQRVSLARKASARRLVARLVAERAAGADGRPLSVDDVFDLGWPGDTTPEPYRSNRVYVLIAKLRAAGLGVALVHDGDGYRLDPAADVRVA